ncbi:hypothetical protein LINGRAHAP2_LOCUS16280 [Linum grandiflorum]
MMTQSLMKFKPKAEEKEVRHEEGSPISLDRKKQEDAPAVASKTTKKMPLITPNRAPASNDMQIVPGIMKVCMKM